MRNNELTMVGRRNGQTGFPCVKVAAPGGQRTARRRSAVAQMRLVLTCLTLCAALSGALPASARAQATLLPGGEYPDAQCTSPMRPFAGDKAWEWDMYRQKMGAYRACVDTYVRRARADIEHIQGKIDKAVREYNREVTMP
ncbi:hypothetical protein FVW20_13590 [Desulfovibrio oxamicus]|uniref:Uncharacterized protein n=1 Tax=Nitratidesulfovibrio oxamicus TaxID=32016 RepID=A0ABS0J6E8_9BACT|nr:hypothetical protein [Nitratidesulfovibrio oxamicus]MBG3878012.1 hypothetical protein [Nitratidesulfovibrio oxamicus]